MLEYVVARDGEEFAVHSNGADWLTAWHSPAVVPEGIAHGANAFCVTTDNCVVLISSVLDCNVCHHLTQCTRAKGRTRTVNIKPKDLHEALQQTRQREKIKEFKEEYSRRAGVEGTISQGVRAFGLRRSRYIGIAKTRLQRFATAAAINLERVSDWLAGIGREKTRRSAFARVMQPLTA